MIQTLFVIALFLGACFYLGRLVYDNFFAKKGPCDGCAIARMYQDQSFK